MKAVTLLQPWASLVACHAKQWETRSWRTDYRGLIGIHSSKRYSRALKEIASTEPFRSSLRHGDQFPIMRLGKIIALGRLVECLEAAQVEPLLDERERAFGDYTKGRWAWRIAEVRPVAPEGWPYGVDCIGHLGIWQVPDYIERVILRGMRA